MVAKYIYGINNAMSILTGEEEISAVTFFSNFN